MKKKITNTLLSMLIFTFVFQLSGKAEPFTATFPVLGNCYLCKIRIEQAVNKLDGIQFVEWDYSTKVTTVTYDDQITDPFIIMTAIANVGHDTEWYPAPDSSYATLIGTCCEYIRTNDYTNVQVGYLSLMDLWVFPVGLDDLEQSERISIYPTAVTSYVNIIIENSTDFDSYDVSVFNTNGSIVYTTTHSGGGNSRVNMESLSTGHYLVIITNKGRVLNRSKIIKL